MSEFFESGSVDNDDDDDSILAAARKYEAIEQTCLDALVCTENNEDALRDAVFKGLQEQDGIYFPDGANDNNCGQYRAMELKALFRKFGDEFNEDLSIDDKEPGLRVTTTSRPDLCVLSELPEGKTEVKFGAVKNGEGYTKELASRQALLYLHSLLCLFRVKLGIPVDMVYGFVICGPKCRDVGSNEYAVGLLILTSPQGLGDLFEGGQYTRAYKTSDSTGLQLLIHVFANGKVSNVETALPDQREKAKRAPCLFAVPRSLWKDQDDPNGRGLVLGGTCAMVFRVSSNKLGELLKEVSQSQLDGILWNTFLEDVEPLKDQADSEKPNDAHKLYVKVRTRDTTTHFDTSGFFHTYNALQKLRNRKRMGPDFSRGVEDFFTTYLVSPYGCDTFTLCIMADRGIRFDTKSVDRNKLHEMLRDLKVQIMGMAKVVFHGDVLYHNLVYNESSGSLHLVDFDESTLLTKKAPRRSFNYASMFPWLDALLYPNALQQEGESYTKVQFAASVILMVMLHPSKSYERLDNIKKLAEELGTLLGNSDRSDICWEGKREVPDDVKSLIEQLDRLIDDLLKTEYGTI